MSAPNSPERLRRLLCRLGVSIRDAIIGARTRNSRNFARIAAVTLADTIYEVDRVSEDAIVAWFNRHWPADLPVEVVMEGVEADEVITFPRGTPRSRTDWKCILDPIDGTRGFMYDKRPAWILAAIAPQRGARTKLNHISVAVMTELPTRKQWRSDQFSAVRGRGVVATAYDLRGPTRMRLNVRPSQASDFKHGFASFARFFTTGKSYTAQIEEALWGELHGHAAERTPVIFDDQYISTGGQIAELLVGHDRMVADIRPLVFTKLGQHSALVCHPYDICTELILREAGGVVEGPDGRPLRAPLDTTTPVPWIGFANPVLAKLARPALRHVLKKFL